MNHTISAFPNIDPSHYLREQQVNDPVLSQKRFFAYASGRAALFYAMKTAALPQGSRVLVPSFHCGVEVEAVKRAGYDVDFYGIKKDLHIDFDDLSLRITKQSRVLVIIHYFGFPQDMDRVMGFCRANNLMLIEDCAHALYSAYQGKWLGSFGAFGIYSLQKTIGLPNGGGLLCNSSDFPDPELGRKYFALTLLKSAVKSILEFKARSSSVAGQISSRILKLYSSITDREKEENTNIDETDMRWYYDVPVYDYHNTISGLSKPLLRKESYAEIVRKRRQNYILLHEAMQHTPFVDIVVKEISEGVCPLCYVVATENRDKLVASMNSMGLYPFVFGRFHHKSLLTTDYPESKYLAGHLIGLPVHQQLNKADIQEVIDFVNKVAE